MTVEKHTSIDFETTPVGFFDRKSKRSDWKGHPRLAKPVIVSHRDFERCEAVESIDGSQKPVFTKPLIFHNAGFDLPIGETGDFWKLQEFNTSDFDCTATMARLSLNSRPAGLKALAKSILNEEVTSYEIAKQNQERFLEYAKRDADFTYRLFPILKKEIEEKGLTQLYEFVEKPFIIINQECQKNGIRIDIPNVKAHAKSLLIEIEQLKKDFPDNLNTESPNQMKSYLYGDLELPVQFLKGKPSTSGKAIKKLRSNPKIESLLKIKDSRSKISQLKQLERFTDPNSSRIYPFINPLGADTGRATSSNPNLQNIKKDSTLRELFIPSDGFKLLVFDFSQIEPRVLAHFLPGTPYSKLFGGDEDFYLGLAKQFLSDVKIEKDIREIAKLVILATFYGMGKGNLSTTLNIPPALAEEILLRFECSFREVADFKNEVICFARENGFSQGLLGRRRYIENLNHKDKFLRARAERQVFNSVIQGSAASLFKFKLNQLRQALPGEARFLHHVHDEVILEAPASIVESVGEQSLRTLETPVDWFSVPIKVEGGIGMNWKEAKNQKIERR